MVDFAAFKHAWGFFWVFFGFSFCFFVKRDGNMYETLGLEGQANDSEGEGLSKASQSARHITTTAVKKDR